MIDKNDPRLTAYLLDELSVEQAAEIAAAIDESAELQEQVEALRGTIGILNRVCKAEGDDALSAQQLASLENAADGNVVASLTDANVDDANVDDANVDDANVDDANVDDANVDDGWAARIRWRNFAIAALVIYAVGMSVFALRKPASLTSLPNGGVVAPKLDPNETELAPRASGRRMETRTRVVDGREESYQVAVPTTESQPAMPSITAADETWDEADSKSMLRFDSGGDDIDAPVALDPFDDAAGGAGGAPGFTVPGGLPTDGLLSELEQRNDGLAALTPEVRARLRRASDSDPAASGDPFAAEDLGEDQMMGMGGMMGGMMGGAASGEVAGKEGRGRAVFGQGVAEDFTIDADGAAAGNSFGLASPFGTPHLGDDQDGAAASRNWSAQINRQFVDSIPAPALPAPADVSGETNVEFVPECGQINIRGSKRDVERVQEVIREIEASGGAADTPEAPREETAEVVDETKEEDNALAIKLMSKKRAAKPKPKTWKPATAATNRRG